MGSGIRTGIRYAQETIVPSTWSHGHIREVLEKFNATEISFSEAKDGGLLLFTMNEKKVRLVFPYPEFDDSEWRINGSGRIWHTREEQEEAHDQIIRCRWRTIWYWVKAKLQAIENEVTTFEKEFGPYFVRSRPKSRRLDDSLHKDR